MIHHDIACQCLDLFYNFEVSINGEKIAHIHHDCSDVPQWVVFIEGIEAYYTEIFAEAVAWIESFYKQRGMLISLQDIAS